jgi:hypothetical protein
LDLQHLHLHVLELLDLEIILSANLQEQDQQIQQVCQDQWVDQLDRVVLVDLDLVDQVVQDLADQIVDLVVPEVLEDLDLVDQVVQDQEAQIVDQVVPEVLVDLDLVDQVVQDLVAQIADLEILVDLDLEDQADQIADLEVLVDQDQVDQIVDQEVPEVLVATDQVDQVEFQPCLVFNHRVVPDNVVELEAAVTQLELLVVKEGLIKNVQNQNVKNVKSLKISWKHHNLVVCNYQKVMAE